MDDIHLTCIKACTLNMHVTLQDMEDIHLVCTKERTHTNACYSGGYGWHSLNWNQSTHTHKLTNTIDCHEWYYHKTDFNRNQVMQTKPRVSVLTYRRWLRHPPSDSSHDTPSNCVDTGTVRSLCPSSPTHPTRPHPRPRQIGRRLPHWRQWGF